MLSSSSASQPQQILLHNLSSYTLRPGVFLPYMIGSIASAPTVKAMATPPTHLWALRHVFRKAPGEGGGVEGAGYTVNDPLQ